MSDTPELRAGRKRRWVGHTLASRFWSKVQITDGHDCWLWTGAQKGRGWNAYGAMKIDGHTTGAHRVSWRLAHGPVPEGLMVLHRCDTPLCVRPDHLFLGTQKDNMRDCAAKGRRAYVPIPRDRKARGEQHANARATEALVREIRQAYDSGATISSLARLHGLSWSATDNIAKRRTWRHVEA